ncbi:MAG TPA: 50S ribosomal protein L22 [Phycisphaeraceae bacterium]|nr:50S ribosomal protein L22 [Phycisphaeraceae bacterium]
MAYVSKFKYARISARKARLVADMIRNKPVSDAMTMLDFSKKRAAVMVKKALNAAIADAEMQDADVSTLYVCESRVDEGPTLKRWRPKDRGRAHPINKRTSHITIGVEEA